MKKYLESRIESLKHSLGINMLKGDYDIKDINDDRLNRANFMLKICH